MKFYHPILVAVAFASGLWLGCMRGRSAPHLTSHIDPAESSKLQMRMMGLKARSRK
jgi:hypothetical protein